MLITSPATRLTKIIAEARRDLLKSEKAQTLRRCSSVG